MKSIYFILLILPLIIRRGAIGSPIPINLLEPDHISRTKFNVQLPSNQTVQINLSFKLLTPSKSLPTLEPANFVQPDDETSSSSNISTPTTKALETDELFSSSETPHLVTGEEAIEDFRRHLIDREMEIGGIIESEHNFYRHFKLEYDEDVVIPVRCTYDSNYSQRSLSIECYEYREIGNERIFSNGEYESALSTRSLPEYINLKSMKQTYSMLIA